MLLKKSLKSRVINESLHKLRGLITKHVKFLELLLTMEVGMQYGNTQQDSLLILSTILPIMLLIFFAEYIAILPLVTVQLQALSSLNMMTMDVHMPDEHSIPKYVNN